MPIAREDAIRLGRFVLVFEGVALLVALVLGAAYSGLARTAFIDGFALTTFLVFVLVVLYAILSGPGMFLSRPRFAPIDQEGRARWRRWLAAPPLGRDREFAELVLFTGLGVLLLLLASGIAAALHALGL